ncbi:OLC1v1020638C2 [Oldenlandia corymbosa var. corymbosa]|uniref:OLC1v1020638C2 n=1 Tax=Oldenlandia corymbosa var. corymbosa TaxID=529605 RepID=A0AAV1EH19_OLDCO|nr:OLC1v1020638C2 [Oldenlandia corymbosa var. corymbosa]
MMEGGLTGTEIHGFRSMEDLDINNIMMEAKGRWLRPNEIYAILSNNKYFNVQVKPVNLPPSGTIVLFDRKMLRNFRKDGHNWKKKKDGKTVKEAHEHLKVGNEERIHVYYAHGEDNPTFVRRCYWLLDKSLEHVVLVHYRETQEVAPSTPVHSNSNSSSGVSDPSAAWVVSEESDSVADQAYYSSQRGNSGLNETVNAKDHELRLHEINTLEWDELVVQDDPNKLTAPQPGRVASGQSYQYEMLNYGVNTDSLLANNIATENFMEKFPGQAVENVSAANLSIPATVSFQASGNGRFSNSLQKETRLMTMFTGDSSQIMAKDNLQTQDSFGRWMNDVIADSPLSMDDAALDTSMSTNQSFPSLNMDSYNSPAVEQMQIFYISDISPSWAFANEETKILVVGFFHERQGNMGKSNLSFVCGDACIPAEVVQTGVFRCLLSPQAPGVVNLFLSFDGQNPISQVVTFEFRAPYITSFDDNPTLQECEVQMRLVHLLFSTSRSLNILSSNVTPTGGKEAKKFSRKTSHMVNDWRFVLKSVKDKKISCSKAKDSMIEITLQNKLREWLLERVIEGCKIAEHDEQGQGVIHLCSILGYTWAVYPFSWSGLSLDYRDKSGWTALHWAAYYGREAMVAKLLSAGAKAYLVTDPTSDTPGGSTAADLASKNGHEGLAAYLAEKALVQHFQDMTLAGNVSGSLQSESNDSAAISGNFNEDELYLKDTLAAYRTAADAAARIQAAFREHSLKVRTVAVESSNPETEARNIVAAMKIQHAFRNYDTRKKMAAAARIQHRFRSWKIRRDFLNMRKQAIRIQAVFRGFQVRKQYRKIIWSVGVLEKAILRWRLKRKGFRGLQVQPDEGSTELKQAGDVVEEDFFQASRKQAEARVERSVIRVQAMFRSKRAQEAYRRMKLAYNSATLEYEELQDPNGMTDD